MRGHDGRRLGDTDANRNARKAGAIGGQPDGRFDWQPKDRHWTRKADRAHGF